MCRFALRIFALVVIATSTAGTLAAQRGGGRGGIHGGAHGGGAFHSVAPAVPAPSVTPAPVSTFRGRVVIPPVVSPAFRQPAPNIGLGINAVRPIHRGHISQPSFGTGFYSPFIWNPPIYAAPSYVDPAYFAPSYVAPNYVTPSVSQSDVDLAYEVQQLQREVDELRQVQVVQPQPQVVAPPPPPMPETPSIPTVLIFRDGRRMSIHNYVIVGQALWILDDKNTTRISVSELDVDATQRENRTQGLRFPLPAR